MKKKSRYQRASPLLGLKKHDHAERTRFLKKSVVPILRRELGKNLIAIAVDGSYARHDDKAFSDLELMVFVKETAKLPRGFSKVCDGLLIEGLFVTEKEYQRTIREPNKDWYIAGSDRLVAVTNRRYIARVGKYKVKNLAQKCDRQAVDMLNEIQEAFGKLLNAIDANNRANLFPILSDAVMSVLRLLALVNRKPYKSLNYMVSEASRFKKKPRGFGDFMKLVTRGKYHDLKLLKAYAQNLFGGIEDLFREKYGENIYDDDLTTIKQTMQFPHFSDDTLETTPPPLEGEHPIPNSFPLEGEDKGGGYPLPRSTKSS